LDLFVLAWDTSLDVLVEEATKMLEARKRTAADGKVWWCVWDTDKKDWSTVTYFGKYRTRKAC